MKWWWLEEKGLESETVEKVVELTEITVRYPSFNMRYVVEMGIEDVLRKWESQSSLRIDYKGDVTFIQKDLCPLVEFRTVTLPVECHEV